MSDFGIVISCSAQSYLFVKGCCASIRYFLGDVPICVLIDGRFDAADLVRTYGVRVINRLSPIDPALRDRSFGWGVTKMIAFWESPWETFLSLDPDTVVWGNPLRSADFRAADIILDQQYARDEAHGLVNPTLYDFLGRERPDRELRRAVVDYCLFDLARLERHFPAFRWQDYLYQFSWTGAFFARRGVLDIREYLDILAFADAHPGVFLGGEMGLLNFLIFRAAAAGRVRVDSAPLQVLVGEEDQAALARRFPVGTRPVVADGDAAVIHWTGPRKPVLGCRNYAAPMTFARRKYHLDAHNRTGRLADWWMRWEEFQSYYFVRRDRVRKWLARRLRRKVDGP
jgi:hypothetical protein